ncbi:MAG: HU family DNA-binding protein, partial [Candidatus Marinimicrobia bacterium]|nr:HU family DNA-binding protein [Candidatus Neomarinimicrobiota bacterium]
NPRTNKIVYVPPRRKAHFKPGKLLKQCLCKPLNEL